MTIIAISQHLIGTSLIPRKGGVFLTHTRSLTCSKTGMATQPGPRRCKEHCIPSRPRAPLALKQSHYVKSDNNANWKHNSETERPSEGQSTTSQGSGSSPCPQTLIKMARVRFYFVLTPRVGSRDGGRNQCC